MYVLFVHVHTYLLISVSILCNTWIVILALLTPTLCLPPLVPPHVSLFVPPLPHHLQEYLMERQELAIEFVFCLVLIEVLTKVTMPTYLKHLCA